MVSGRQIVSVVTAALKEKKASNLVILDVSSSSTLTSYFIVAEGNVDTHVIALAHAVKDAMKLHQYPLAHEEGLKYGEWVVLDYDEVIVHLFVPTLRTRYQIEQVWSDAHLVSFPQQPESIPSSQIQSREYGG